MLWIWASVSDWAETDTTFNEHQDIKYEYTLEGDSSVTAITVNLYVDKEGGRSGNFTLLSESQLFIKVDAAFILTLKWTYHAIFE